MITKPQGVADFSIIALAVKLNGVLGSAMTSLGQRRASRDANATSMTMSSGIRAVAEVSRQLGSASRL